MPSLGKLFNRHSAGKLALKVIAAEALAFSAAGCAATPPVPARPDHTEKAATIAPGSSKAVLVNPVVPHILGTDAHGVSPWQSHVAYPDNNYEEKWLALMGRHQMLMTDPTNRKIVDDWFSQFDSLKHKSIEEKATAVEKAANAYITYASDNDFYQSEEYLASPLETIMNKKGDCEDYAILKYYALRYLGVPAENMYLVFVPQSGPEGHAILLVNTNGPGQTPDYLDLDNHRDTSLKRGKDLPYKAYYLINETGYWVTPESPYETQTHKKVPESPAPAPQTFSP